jgi:hypothetical protein
MVDLNNKNPKDAHQAGVVLLGIFVLLFGLIFVLTL